MCDLYKIMFFIELFAWFVLILVIWLCIQQIVLVFKTVKKELYVFFSGFFYALYKINIKIVKYLF
ncbi:hypothetical protein FLB_25630 [Flavobacterium succinicans]|uniref:Uncharacterized protein n=1 Tax=Flavobacterium succinicans TaxID=29536 RepID=A0A199XN93_9FLAO|nr:hypothetical protein FLB_25630 [Flavobacterium succinicans]